METIESTNILTRSGLDFEVEKRPHYVRHFSGLDGETFSESKLSSGIFRTDTGDEIGDVGTGYEPLQNAEILQPFLAATKEGYLTYKHGSAIDGGRRFQLTFETGDNDGGISVHGEDLRRRIIVGSSHDGSWSTFIKTFVYRQICSNGLMGFGLKDSFRVKHTTNNRAGYAMVLKQLAETEKFYQQAFDRYSHLFDVQMDYAQMKRLTNILLDIDETATEKDISGRKLNQRKDILYLTKYGRGIRSNDEIQNTAAAWFNAVAEYVDHVPHKDNKEKRFVSAFFGSGETRKKKAWDLVAAL